MIKFVNRESELELITDAVDTLFGQKRLLRTPIIEFYGVDGIGKTSLLKETQTFCLERGLRCIWQDDNTAYASVREPQRVLAENKPVVILLDTLDAVDPKQLPEVKVGLQNLTENSNVFIVMASRKMERFEDTRTLARKLKLVPLKPLKRESCGEYFDSLEYPLNPEIRNIIYDWTRGYPLAMDVMVNTIRQKNLDPINEQDSKQLISAITKKVIDQSLLARSSDHTWHRPLLSLLSMPRRFNLTLIQEIIERFTPDVFHQESTLAYMTIPDKINEVTQVLSWSSNKGGYCVDAPIRHLLLLEKRITNPKEYARIHMFLAEHNERLAKKVTGPDHVRYLREYFYHFANSGDTAQLPAAITHYIKTLEGESPDLFTQFYEEFKQDDELQESLGNNCNLVLSLLHQHQAAVYKDLAETSESDRVNNIKKFFFHTIHDPEAKDFPLFFEQEMQHFKPILSEQEYTKLIDMLAQDQDFKTVVEQHFDNRPK